MKSRVHFDPSPWSDPRQVDAAWICARYESIRARLPVARFPQRPALATGLLELADKFDVFLLDAFGVLNVGDEAIGGAPGVVEALQKAGKSVLVLTNGATLPAEAALAKYRAWGYRFALADVIASRDLVLAELAGGPSDMIVGFAAPEFAIPRAIPGKPVAVGVDRDAYRDADRFVLLSSRDWSESAQALLREALIERPRPLLVANPDVAAPRESGFSLEPGHFGHLLADLPGVKTQFFGKPFSNAFEEAFERLRARGVRVRDRRRVAMVGDSLHTDILGGCAAGCRTVLVSDHGLFRGVRYDQAIAASGIVPDFIVPSI